MCQPEEFGGKVNMISGIKQAKLPCAIIPRGSPVKIRRCAATVSQSRIGRVRMPGEIIQIAQLTSMGLANSSLGFSIS